ncbi:MAG: SIR2 family protein [Anaerolineae bacterium]|nr:SIR2 family protein [Anaerolineae bacterium]
MHYPQVLWLIEALEHSTLTLFLGADLPQTVTGLPSRTDLAHGLAQRHSLDAGLSLAQIAQRVSRAGNRFDFTDYLRRELDTAGQPVPTFYRNLAAFAKAHTLPAIVTTAYDDFLERALRDAGVPFDRRARGSDIAFARPDRLALHKLYGDVQMPDTLVVTEDDHYGLWRDRDKENLLDEVRSLLKKQTVLFLGYNLSDPDFHLLWREVLDKMGRFARTAYAIWPGLPETEVRMWADRGIVILGEDPWGLLVGDIQAYEQSTLESRPPTMTVLDTPLTDHTLPRLADVLSVYPEKDGEPHRPGNGGQWFSRLVVKSTRLISNCDVEVQEIRRLSGPDDFIGEHLPEFTASNLSWAKKGTNGFFGAIDIRAGRKECIDLAWRDRGDSQISAEDLRVASALDPGDRNDKAKGRRQDFIILKPSSYLFTIRVFAKNYNDWIERTYRLYWPGASQEPDIHLAEMQKEHKTQDLEVTMPETPSISPELYQHVQAVLLRCGSFRSDSDLPPLFVDSRISLWRDDLPSANSSSKRVQAVVDYLLPKFNTAGENALVLLLRVLRDHVSRGDACYGQLEGLAEQLADVVRISPPIVTQSQPTPSVLPASLSGTQKRQLIDALLTCPTVSNRGTRDIVVNDLPAEIRVNIRRNDVDRFDVSNIVTTCLNYEDGVHEFIEAVRFYESNSIPMQTVDNL